MDTQCSELSDKKYMSKNFNEVEIKNTLLDDLIDIDVDQEDNDTFYTAYSTSTPNPSQNDGSRISSNILPQGSVSVQVNDVADVCKKCKNLIYLCCKDESLRHTPFVKNNSFKSMPFELISTNELRKLVKKRCIFRHTETNGNKPESQNWNQRIDSKHLIENVTIKSKANVVKHNSREETNFKCLEEQIRMFEGNRKKRRGEKKHVTKNKVNKFESFQNDRVSGSYSGHNMSNKYYSGYKKRTSRMSRWEFNSDTINPPTKMDRTSGGIIYECETDTGFGKVTQRIKRAYLAS